MASLKLRFSTWYAVWTQNKKQVVRTTNIKAKGPKEKKLAQTAADAMESAAKGNIAVSSAVDALHKVAETLGMSTGMPAVKEYLLDYTPNGRENNKRNYARAAKVFIEYLDVNAYKRLDLLTTAQCKNFLIEQLQRVSYGTVKQYKSMIDAALNASVRDGVITKNPMGFISLPSLLPDGTKRATKRLPFTMEEIRTIINNFPYPWSQMTLTSYLTGGQRLGDIALLKWKNVDFQKKIIHIRTSKTGTDIVSPITPILELALEKLYDENEEYVFPTVARQHMRSRGKLSIEFTALLRAHGILEQTKEVTTGDRRPVSPKSFHSIRHTVVSQMRCNPAITADLSREIVGHASDAVEQGYFTAPSEAKMAAFDFLCKQLAPTSEENWQGLDLMTKKSV